jgi:tRNA threonylcarbamoyladenosine biosynthesis protein TsaB
VIVLGFDTATSSTAVALRLADGRTRELRDDPSAGAHPGHATRLLALGRELLARAGLRWSEIERIAVGIGPGTFTGLRVGIATARGLAQSLEVELVGVSTPRSLAQAALAEGGPTDASHGGRADRVLAVIDARRGEAFAGAYELGADALAEEILPPRALAPADLLELIPGESAGAGVRWLAVGDGAVRFREQLSDSRVVVPPDPSPLHLVSAACTCALGALEPAPESTAQIVPDYRRRPDAELSAQRAGVGGGERG